ncbi:MAG: hypothetical protein MZV70_53610 [Desulfobacterales bacterium]|nr:hypothetical protein [Desulfobacterales bacterium]
MNLDAPEGPLARKADVYAILRRTEKPSPYNTLVRLFILGSEVSTQAAQEALDPLKAGRPPGRRPSPQGKNRHPRRGGPHVIRGCVLPVRLSPPGDRLTGCR